MTDFFDGMPAVEPSADTGFARPINNATLIQYNTYNSGQDELALLLTACGNSFPRLIAKLKTLGVLQQ